MFKSLSINKLVDDEYRRHIQMIVVPLLTGTVSFGMFILNIFTHKQLLMYSTMVYSFLSYLNALIEYRAKRAKAFPVIMLHITTIALFTSFIVYGGTEGFSPIWICSLPTFELLLMGRKKGSAVCGAMFAVIIFFYWTPFGRSLLRYDFTASYMMRFPLVYIALYLISLFFENIREATYRELLKVQKQYRELSIKDTLTDTYNRYWFNETFAGILKKPEVRRVALMIIDIDYFKSFNDTHGHLFGDEVLKRTAAVLREEVGEHGSVCRWGGEEFAVLMENCGEDEMTRRAEKLRKTIEETRIEDECGNDIGVTVSIGAVCIKNGGDISLDRLVSLADSELYKAKTAGRNCVRAECVGA